MVIVRDDQKHDAIDFPIEDETQVADSAEKSGSTPKRKQPTVFRPVLKDRAEDTHDQIQNADRSAPKTSPQDLRFAASPPSTPGRLLIAFGYALIAVACTLMGAFLLLVSIGRQTPAHWILGGNPIDVFYSVTGVCSAIAIIGFASIAFGKSVDALFRRH